MSSSVFVKMCGFAATALLGAALAQADVQPVRILCYGDSTTWGQVGASYGDMGGASYPCLLQNLLGNRYEVKCICLSGSTVADMLVWRGVRELRTKPYWGDTKKTAVADAIVLKKDGSFTGIAFTGDSNPFCFVAKSADDICRGYTGYPVYGSATEAGGLFWPTHDGAAFTKAEADACGLPAGAYSDYGEHLSDGIGRCRCYYDPNDAAKSVDVEIRYSSSLRAAMRLLEPQANDVTIPSGSRIVPIDTTETWKSDLHIIMFGLNDSNVLGSDQYWELVKEATDRIVADGGRYLVLMSQSAYARRPKDWETKMKAYFGNRYLDLYGKFTEKDESGDYKCFAYAEALGYSNVRTTELQAAAKIPITFSTDKLHPQEIGYDLMAHWVYDKLVELGEIEPEPTSGTAVPPTAKTRVRYEGAEKMGVDPGCGYTLSDHLATDAGPYTATATLKSGFTWDDGTTASRPISWEIEKGAPIWEVCMIEPSTWEEGNPPETILLRAETRDGAAVTCAKTVEELKALPAGKHKIAFTAAESANCLKGSKSVSITVTERSSEPGEVTAPTAATGLAYTGKPQTGVAAATGYTVTGGTATDAGDYTATATLAAGYKWTDGTTEPKKISWSIAKGVNTWKTNPSVSPATWAVDAVPETVTIANGATTFGATVTCDTTEAALKALKGGESKTVTFTAAGTKNYDAITKTVTVTVTSGETPVDPDPPEMLLTPTNFTWCGGASGVWKSAENWQVEAGCSSDYPHEKWANVHFPSDADVTLNNTKLYIHNVTAAEGVSLTFRKSSGTNFRPTSPFAPPKNGSIVFDGASLAVSKEGENYSYLTFSLNSSVEFRNGCTLSSSATVFSGSATGGKKFTLRDNGRSFCADFNWRSGKSSTKANPAEIYVTNSVLTCVSETGCQLAVGSSGYTLLHVADGQFHLPCRFTPSGSAYAFRITLGASPETMPTNAPIYFARDVSLSNDVFAVDARACKVAGTYPLVVSGGKSFAVPSDWFDGEGALQAAEDFDYTLQVASGMTGKVRQASDYLGLELVLTAGGDDPTPPVDPEAGLPVLTAPADGATVAMLTDRQKQAIAHGGESWDGGNLGDNKAHPVVLSWTGTTGQAHVTVVRVKDGSTLIDETTDAGTLAAYNMLLGEEYRWTVTTASGSASRTFTVELQAPRVIMVQATNGTDIAELNMRDLGGWVGKDGHRVKQGLLYRSRKLSDPYPEGYDPTAVDGRGYPLMSDAGIFVLANRFGIRTELDFRSQRDQARGIVRSVLGPNVEYINQGMLQPEMLILQSSVGNSMLKANMDVIFNRSKYPLDFHCKDGNSRTGGLAYYLLGLLGVDIMDAAADYMWTKYAVSGKKYWADTDFRHMYANVTTNHVFTAADGTVYDRGTSFMNVCESFTLANGYTMEEIEAFREFMLEGYASGEDPVVTHTHVWGAWETNVAATCTNEGVRVARCVNACPDIPVATTNEVLPKVAHRYEGGKCAVCGADDPGYVPPTPPTPAEGLPEGYTAAAAVTSVTGDSVWFDTNHKPTSDTVSQIKFTFTKDGGAGLYGYLSPSLDDGTDYRLAATSGKWMLDLGDNTKRIGQSGAAAPCGTATANVENYLEIGNYYIKDLAADETLASVTPVTFARDYTLRIFGKQAGFAAYGSVVSLKIFEKGTLVHDFVPCTSPEGVTGLFDLCTSYFHQPDGTFAKVEGGDDPALTPVAAPTAVTGLAYTGKPQTGVAAATGYTVTGGAATDAGDYTATATLAAGYKWTDGTTDAKKIGWSIAKGTNAWTTNPSVSPASWAADAVPGAITIANGATTFGAAVTCDTTVAALKELGEGDHTVTFTAAGTKNYDTLTKTVTVTVTAGTKPDPEPMGADWGWSNRVTVAGQDYCVLAFTNTAEAGFSWTVPSGVTAIDYLVVGGGGAGGAVSGGGGGAGGFATGTVAVASSGVKFSVKVGAGGVAPTEAADGGDGVGSSLHQGDVCVAAVRGGGGGGNEGMPGHDGGCGGGGGRSLDANVTAGGVAIDAGLGFGGGTGFSATTSYYGGGGGGGAGATGGNGKASVAGVGGAGVPSSITGEEVWYAGGGGGAVNKSGQAAGGQGGGGTGGTSSAGNPESGTDGLGGGGGGSRAVRYGQPGRGGSGIVIIRYAVAEGPVPTPDPVVPGAEPKAYASEAAAIAAKPEKVTPPEDVMQALAADTEALANYVACFTVETRQQGGKWINVAALTAEAEGELQQQVNDGAAKVVAALASDTVTLEPVTPGFRYALEYGEELEEMALQAFEIATEASLTLQLPKTAGATSGFYRVVVREAETK